jgi:hypothetical protein
MDGLKLDAPAAVSAWHRGPHIRYFQARKPYVAQNLLHSLKWLPSD